MRVSWRARAGRGRDEGRTGVKARFLLLDCALGRASRMHRLRARAAALRITAVTDGHSQASGALVCEFAGGRGMGQHVDGREALRRTHDDGFVNVQ